MRRLCRIDADGAEGFGTVNVGLMVPVGVCIGKIVGVRSGGGCSEGSKGISEANGELVGVPSGVGVGLGEGIGVGVGVLVGVGVAVGVAVGEGVEVISSCADCVASCAYTYIGRNHPLERRSETMMTMLMPFASSRFIVILELRQIVKDDIANVHIVTAC